MSTFIGSVLTANITESIWIVTTYESSRHNLKKHKNKTKVNAIAKAKMIDEINDTDERHDELTAEMQMTDEINVWTKQNSRYYGEQKSNATDQTNLDTLSIILF